MKIKTNIVSFLATIGVLAACSDDITPNYTVGEVDNAIVLVAGVAERGGDVLTRTASENHTKPGHVNFAENTRLTLQVSGTWIGKNADDKVVQTTEAVTKDKAGQDNRHNEVDMLRQLYWDDYGTADPANIDEDDNGTATNGIGGREKGLTIYGVAVNDASVAATEVVDWKSLSWTLPFDQTGGWSESDLLTSNNITESGDGTYKFDDYMAKKADPSAPASDIIEFTHAMSKITVKLTAGDGFVDNKFETAPTVTLMEFKYTGTVDIVNKTSVPTSDVANINMHLCDGGASRTTATFDALVYPGNKFDKVADQDVDIIELMADGNKYIVTAAKLNSAIQKAITNKATTNYPGTDNTLLQGWNYKLSIIVHKTAIDVEATIVDWADVQAEDEAPIIRIDTAYGLDVADKETQFKGTFDFFRSLTIDSGYSDDAYVSYEDATNEYEMHNQLYWPDHQTHYFFRGVYPRVGVEDGQIPSDNVTESTSNASKVIVSNAPYAQGKYPSDLAIGYPRGNKNCTHGNDVAENGICATEGAIRMNFRYAMAKVEVHLKSTATDDSKIHLENSNISATVAVIGGYNKGRIQLSDGLHDTYGPDDKGDYTLTNLTSAVGDDCPVATRDAIVPQDLGDDVIFRVTITDNNGTPDNPTDDKTDVYECKVNSICKVGTTTPVDKWVNGNYYFYELDVKKTGIKVTATIKDWETVETSQEIWF